MEYFDDIDPIKTYLNKIQNLIQWVWKNNISQDQLSKWRSNFSGEVDHDPEHEEINSLFLLRQYMYFGLTEIRQILSAMYRLYFCQDIIREIKLGKNLVEIQEDFDNQIKSTVFIGLGNPSESGSLLLYFFRQENSLKKDSFWHTSQIFQYSENGDIVGIGKIGNSNPMNYVFIDDLVGSGNQAISYFCNNNGFNVAKKIKEFNKNSKIYYLTMFCTKEAKQKLLHDIGNDVIIKSVFELDDTYKVFSQNSRYFLEKDVDEKNYAKSVSDKNFDRLGIKNNSLKYGYCESELLLGFFYNTPDNTLPIFWAESKEWCGLFKRYDKF